jgi:uncharacterized membrane protein YecN with MAPEG domain
MLTVTGLYGTVLSFLIIFLAARLVRLRVKHRVGFLDGGQPDLTKAMRIHGNAIETIPLALILMACAEASHLPLAVLHGAGIVLVFARVFHAYGLNQSAGQSKGRTYGTLLTWIVILFLGFCNLMAFIKTQSL